MSITVPTLQSTDLAVAARAVDAVKVYGSGATEVRALDGINVEFAAGRWTAIMGPSGSGKSTLLRRMAGLDDRLHHRPSELSGGQHQPVAAARAMITRPDLVFADEPTGNLDSKSATEMLEMTRAAVQGFGQTVVMVTHDARAASYADRVVFVADGRIQEAIEHPTMNGILDELKRLGV